MIQEDFDWLCEEETSYGFFKYHGHWYHIAEFVRLPENHPLRKEGWEAFSADSFFSGVAIRVSGDADGGYGETLQVALILS